MADKKKAEDLLKERVKELNAIIKAAVDVIYNKHPNEEECRHQKAIIASANETLYEVKQELGLTAAGPSRTNPECVEKSTR
jgi:hypothetical protein